MNVMGTIPDSEKLLVSVSLEPKSDGVGHAIPPLLKQRKEH